MEADEGRLHPAGARRARSARASTRTASSASSCAARLDADSPYADVAVHGDGLTSLQFRRTKGAVTEQIESAVKGADVVQLERKGNTYTMSVARFGEPFTVSEVAGPGPGRRASTSGLFLCSHNPDVVERAVFRDVRIIRPAKDGFVPYRDYIGSHLEVLDVATGRRQVVLRVAPSPFEAPELDAGRQAPSSTTRAAAAEGRGRLHPLRPGDAPADAHRHRLREPQQQRPRALVRRDACSAISDQSADERPVDDLHAARRRAARRSASRRSRRRTSTAGRRTAKYLVYTGGRERRVRHLQDRRRTAAARRSG